MLNGYIFYYKFIKFGRIGKVRRQEFYRSEFGKIENVRFHKYGRGDIKPFADICKVLEKLGINKFPVAFVSKLFYYFFAY